jgi:hypothetical protein
MLVPVKELKETPEKYGFKKCKKPYDICHYKCFARGCKMMFLSSELIMITDWEDSDPRIHKRANCSYKDSRTAEDFLCELIMHGLVRPHYNIETNL